MRLLALAHVHVDVDERLGDADDLLCVPIIADRRQQRLSCSLVIGPSVEPSHAGASRRTIASKSRTCFSGMWSNSSFSCSRLIKPSTPFNLMGAN